MYAYIMPRTQITLTDAQYRMLREESANSGLSLAELVRQAVDERYDGRTREQRLELLDRAFGGWAGREEGGEEFVDRVRSGTARRVGRA